MKKYKAIFFDWDGTAVTSRSAPADEVAACMKPLLQKGIKLVVVSGTTIENIAGGKLHQFFTAQELGNLYMGLGRGAYNYAYTAEGKPYLLGDSVPPLPVLIQIHEICFDIHKKLLETYGIPTDIVFSRPNYCKIDLMVDNNRGDQLFFQESELEQLTHILESHGFMDGMKGLIKLADDCGNQHGLKITATTDAKYLEVGLTSKSDNVNEILTHLSAAGTLLPEECAYWGDEYIGLDEGLCGSDGYMMTDKSIKGDFFDVSAANGIRPDHVTVLHGGVERFLEFLREQV